MCVCMRVQTIFMRSYSDRNYRAYVLNQFKMKKQKIESIIEKHQEELKILEETMENIIDGLHHKHSHKKKKNY